MNNTIQPIDIAIRNKNGSYYDFYFADNGDFELDRSYETAIRMSLFLDSRADDSEVVQASMQRGWWGNKLLDSIHQIGSKLWLLNQNRATVKNRNKAKDYAKQSLQWLINNKHAKEINIQTYYNRFSQLIMIIEILYLDNILKTYRFNLWQNTEEL